MAKVKLSELTKEEQVLFGEEVKKSKEQTPKHDGVELWPEDDEGWFQNTLRNLNHKEVNKMSSIREELLLKAQRDTSKLVRVQRQVSRGGKTFIQNFWVQPSQVKSTDTVIGGQQNLLPTPGSVATPAAGVLDKAYLDSISSDKSKAFDYLKKCGLTWKENPHEGINWMRAMQAVKAALNGQNSVKMSNQVNAQSQSQTVQNGQNSQAGNRVLADSVKAAAILDQNTLDELKQYKTGKEKVVVLKKKLGQDGCIKFAKLLGVTWDEHTHKGINIMRMSMALQKHLDSNGSISVPTGTGDVGAPIGNQNAKKDKVKAEEVKPKEGDKLEIPPNATKRQKNLIKFINATKDEKELKAYIDVGMIPEDDVAKSFFWEKLVPKYRAFMETDKGRALRNNPSQEINGVQDISRWLQNSYGNIVSGIEHMGDAYEQWTDYFNAAQLTHPRYVVGNAYTGVVGTGTLGIDIIDSIRIAYSSYTRDDFNGEYKTNLGYDGWDSEEYKKQFDPAKDGFIKYLRHIADTNPSVKPQTEKMELCYLGMMRKLQYNPKHLEEVLNCSTWNSGAGKAGKFVNVCGNTKYAFRSLSSNDAKRTLEILDSITDNLMLLLKRKGLSESQIQKFLFTPANVRDSLTSFRLPDPEHVRSPIDLCSEVNPDTGKPYLDSFQKYNQQARKGGSSEIPFKDDTFWAFVKDYARYKNFSADTQREKLSNAIRDEYEIQQYSKHVMYISQLQLHANLSQEGFIDIHRRSLQLFGQKLTGDDEDINSIDYDYMADCAKLGVWLGVRAKDDNPEQDLIVANLHMAYASIQANSKINKFAPTYVPKSRRNDATLDCSTYVNFYYPGKHDPAAEGFDTDFSGLRALGNRQGNINNGFGCKKITVDELNSKIDRQMKDTPQVTQDYRLKLKQYYKDQCHSQATEEEVKNNARLGEITNSGILLSDDKKKLSLSKAGPLKDVFFAATNNMLSCISRLGVSSQDSQLAKEIDYTPYDFNPQPSSDVELDSKQLKKLREKAFKAVHCSFSTEEKATSEKMYKDFIERFDYPESGAKDPDGNFHKKMYSGHRSANGLTRRALVNSRFFRVNNSNMQEAFKGYNKKLKQTPMDLFSATSYAGCAGILGATGGWDMEGKATKVATALGPGAYFGYRGGKSIPYCGEGSGGYHFQKKSGAEGDNSNGCYILANVIRGVYRRDSKTDKGSFNDWEICVSNNKCIFPHHFVDVSARAIGKSVERDAQGNYVDLQGNITHDKNGVSVNIK